MKDCGPPLVVFVKFEPRDRFALAMAMICFWGVGVWALLAGGDDALVFAIILIALGAVAAIALAWRFERRGALKARLNAPATTRRDRRRLVEALVNLGALERGLPVVQTYRWNFEQANAARAAHGIHEPLCIVDRRFRSLIDDIEMIGDLIECEPVGQSMRDRRVVVYLIGGAAMFALSGLVLSWRNALSGCGMFIFGMIGIGFMATALQRWWVAGHGSLARARGLLVGPGAMADPSHVWQARGSLTVVRYQSGQVLVTILDDHGRVSLKYLESPPDSFAEFWRRWMHPNPRPDLVLESARQSQTSAAAT